MSLVNQNKKPVKLFLMAILIGMVSLYLLCDYYLQSVGRELMVNWIRTESASIQEGNLLTSSTKNQRFILSSDYIRAVKLIRVDQVNNQVQVRERLHFGDQFEISANEIPEMNKEVEIQTSGFLHKKAFYKIPDRDEMYMIFDIESQVLNTVFLAVAAILLLMVISLVAMIRAIEKKEFLKREEIFKQAISEFISKDTPSQILVNDFPSLVFWWKDKKEQVAIAQDIAIKNQSKILLGETASRVGHDIMGSVRNIEILFKRTTGLNEMQANVFYDSVAKIKTLASGILRQTRQSIEDRELSSVNDIDFNQVLADLIEQKRIQYDNQFQFTLMSKINKTNLGNVDALELERSVSNLINNAIEASNSGSEIIIDLTKQDEMIKIQIKDQGHGISSENIKKIGTKGFTANKSNGTGIGMFYAKQFVDRLGGKLIVDSVLNQGTTVSMILPVI